MYGIYIVGRIWQVLDKLSAPWDQQLGKTFLKRPQERKKGVIRIRIRARFSEMDCKAQH